MIDFTRQFAEKPPLYAGILPQWSAEQTLELAQEVESVLRGPNWISFLAQMYGNHPARWEDSLQGADRLRYIVNGLTRTRFCSPDSIMDSSKFPSLLQ